MPYFLISCGPVPTQAGECTVLCNEEMAVKLVDRFDAKFSDGEQDKNKPLIKALLDRAISLVYRRQIHPEYVPRYYVPTSPHNIINFLEKQGYKLNATATNKDYFLWTLHKEEPMESPINKKRPLPELPGPTQSPTLMGKMGLEGAVRKDTPRRVASHLEYLDLRVDARAATNELHEASDTLHHDGINVMYPYTMPRDAINAELQETSNTLHLDAMNPIFPDGMNDMLHDAMNNELHFNANTLHHEATNALYPSAMNAVHHDAINAVHHAAINPVHHAALNPVHHDAINAVHHDVINTELQETVNTLHLDGTNAMYPGATNAVYPGATNAVFQDAINAVHHDAMNTELQETMSTLHLDGTNAMYPHATNAMHRDAANATSNEPRNAQVQEITFAEIHAPQSPEL